MILYGFPCNSLRDLTEIACFCICILQGVLYEVFFYLKSPNPTRFWRWVLRKAISQENRKKMHFYAYFILRSASIMLYIVHKV